MRDVIVGSPQLLCFCRAPPVRVMMDEGTPRLAQVSGDWGGAFWGFGDPQQ